MHHKCADFRKLWFPLWEHSWMQCWTWSTTPLDSPWPLGWPCWVWREERKGFGWPLATYLQLQVVTTTYTVIQVDIYVATIKYLTMRIFQWGWHILCNGPRNVFELKCNKAGRRWNGKGKEGNRWREKEKKRSESSNTMSLYAGMKA